MNSCFTICCCVIVILLAQGRLTAQPTSAPATQPELRKLTLHPSPATQPWLEHRLMTPPTDQHAGNAVPFYLQAQNFWPDQKTTDAVLEPENHKYDYLDTPIEEFPPQYIQPLLDAYADTLHYIDVGAACRDARWDEAWNVSWHDSPFHRIRFDYLNGLRHVENLLSFRARVEIHQGRWPAARHTIQTMMAVAQHVGSDQAIAHQLVANSFSELVQVNAIIPWISDGKSDNLYWSLTVLPTPLVRINPNDADNDAATRVVRPAVAQAIDGTLPADQWNQALYEMVSWLTYMRTYENNPDKTKVLAEIDRLIKLKLEASRKALRERGTDDATLNAMAPQQIVGLQLIYEYRAAAANVWKSFGLPFPEAQAQMLRAWKEIAPQQSPALDNPLIQSDLVAAGLPVNYRAPAALNRRYQLERIDRHIALLRCIEALRDYAASHDGRPPERLEQITNVPVPVDPMTGRNFGYEAHGQIVTLDATPPAPFGPFGGWRYELTFVK